MSASLSSDDLPDDLISLRALVAAERAKLADEHARHEAEIARLEAQLTERDSEVERLNAIIHGLMRHRFGKRSEKLDPDQQALALDDLETALEAAKADQEERNPTLKEKRKGERSKKRGELPPGLPKIERIIDIDSKVCPCCGEDMHVIGEDKTSRLHTIPAQRFELVTRRPKYACRACTDGVHQAPAPPSIVEGGLPTEATIAHMLVAKYADHLPVYRQWQMLQREGIHIQRSVLIGWVGRGAWALIPIAERMLEKLKTSTKLFCDETTAPVLDPGRGRTKKGYLWSIARDDRPWGGAESPGVVYCYAPGRGGEHIIKRLAGFQGVLQVDGYSAYNALADSRFEGDVSLAFCWAHLRREFYDIAQASNAPIAQEALVRIAALYAVEAEIRGKSADVRRAARQAKTRPLMEALKTWFEAKLSVVSQKSGIAKAVRYALKRWDGLTLFLEDGRIEIDNNTVERSIRGIALNRKNALFAGSDEGGRLWGVVASIIETCKLNGVEPHAYLTDVLAKIAGGWSNRRLDELLPWAYAQQVADT